MAAKYSDSDGSDFEFVGHFMQLVPPDAESESDLEVNVDDDSDSEEVGSDTESESDESLPNVSCGVWSDATDPVDVEAFVGESGPVHALDASAEPFDYFSLIVTEDFYQMAADQTNLYAAQRQEQAKKVDASWTRVTPADIKLFMHITIHMGVVVLPTYHMYWSTNELVAQKSISGCMSRDRFKKISQYFHLNDSSKQSPKGHENYDPLYKVRPFLDMVKRNIASCFKPGKNISIDEAMIPFNGRLGFKQYIKGKPNPWGIKVWCAADSATGYLLNFDVYVGKVHDPMPHGSGHYVVTKLGRPFFGRNHHFFFDNYFASVQLAQDLLCEKTYSCSTIRSNRKGWPLDCRANVTKKMKKGSVIFRQQGNVVATVWRDKRIVNLLSTNVSPGMTTVSRRAASGRQELQIPTTVSAYNQSMGGVDKFDQLCSYYAVGRKSHKWWRYLFSFLLQTAIINSWIICSNSHRTLPLTKAVGHIDFRLAICSALMKGSISRRRKSSNLQPTSTGLGTTSISEHRLIRMAGRRGRDCHYCVKRSVGSKRAKETVFGCSLCQIYLCKGVCFTEYHRLNAM